MYIQYNYVDYEIHGVEIGDFALPINNTLCALCLSCPPTHDRVSWSRYTIVLVDSTLFDLLMCTWPYISNSKEINLVVCKIHAPKNCQFFFSFFTLLRTTILISSRARGLGHPIWFQIFFILAFCSSWSLLKD